MNSSRRAPRLGGLDGLRALAVIAVIAFHCDLPWAPGGFLGVDVFFVVSGYLITSQLWARGMHTGRVDLKRFWIGRARRLFPALFAMLVATTGLVALADSRSVRSYLGDLLGALTYTSNWWYIGHHRSYFEAMGRPPVLQHLWSLAVEEQFYLLWPLMVALVLVSTRSVMRRQRRLLVLCLTLALASGLWMGIGTALIHAPLAADPSRFYFGTDAHASGLLLGAAFATLRAGRGFTREMPALRPATIAQTLAGTGALLAVLAFFWQVNSWTPWLYRVGFLLFPLVTLVLIAAATRPGPLQRLLDARLLVALGQRSYGLYLWHWPVVAFTRPGLDIPASPASILALRLTLTLALAEASYRWLERPILRYGLRGAWVRLRGVTVVGIPARRLVTGTVATVTGLTAIAALIASPARGTSVPVASPTRPTAASTTLPSAAPSTPATVAPTTTPSAPPTHPSDPAQMSVAVYGDSVALGAQPGLQSRFRDVAVTASVGEQAYDLLDQLDAAAPGLRADLLVVHTGNNGIISKEQLAATLSHVPARIRIVVVLPRVPRPWQDPNLQVIKDVAAQNPRVKPADWYGISDGHRDYFTNDGVHLTPAGVDAYANLIVAAAKA